MWEGQDTLWDPEVIRRSGLKHSAQTRSDPTPPTPPTAGRFHMGIGGPLANIKLASCGNHSHHRSRTEPSPGSVIPKGISALQVGLEIPIFFPW